MGVVWQDVELKKIPVMRETHKHKKSIHKRKNKSSRRVAFLNELPDVDSVENFETLKIQH